MMSISFQKKLADSYRVDLLDCIEKAKQGKLAPSKQEYCFDEIEKTKGTDAYPEEGDDLFRQLRNVLSSTGQLSELEQETAEVKAFGGNLLLFYYLDRYTMMELVEQPDGAGYDSFVYISSEHHGNELRRIADQMKAALEDWLCHTFVSHGEVGAADQPNETDICRYQPLDTAISFLYTGLKFPESILC